MNAAFELPEAEVLRRTTPRVGIGSLKVINMPGESLEERSLKGAGR
jgi:hypothetical protein